MNDSKIPVRYAKSFFELALEKKITDKVYSDMQYIHELVKLQEIKDVLNSPVIVSSVKLKAILAILNGNVEKLTESFITMVFKNKRESYLAGISRDFITLFKNYKSIKSVEITSAVNLDEKMLQTFKEQVQKAYNSEIELVSKTNPDIVGGFIVQVDDVLYDASIKRQLKNIKNTLLTEK